MKPGLVPGTHAAMWGPTGWARNPGYMTWNSDPLAPLPLWSKRMTASVYSPALECSRTAQDISESVSSVSYGLGFKHNFEVE